MNKDDMERFKAVGAWVREAKTPEERRSRKATSLGLMYQTGSPYPPNHVLPGASLKADLAEVEARIMVYGGASYGGKRDASVAAIYGRKIETRGELCMVDPPKHLGIINWAPAKPGSDRTVLIAYPPKEPHMDYSFTNPTGFSKINPFDVDMVAKRLNLPAAQFREVCGWSRLPISHQRARPLPLVRTLWILNRMARTTQMPTALGAPYGTRTVQRG